MFSENIKINRWKEHLDLIIIQKDKHLGCIFYALLWRHSEKMHRKFLIYTTSLVSIISKIVFVWWPYDNYLIRQNNIWKNEFGSRVALWFLLGGALSLSLSGMPRGAETRSFFSYFSEKSYLQTEKNNQPTGGSRNRPSLWRQRTGQSFGIPMLQSDFIQYWYKRYVLYTSFWGRFFAACGRY